MVLSFSRRVSLGIFPSLARSSLTRARARLLHSSFVAFVSSVTNEGGKKRTHARTHARKKSTQKKKARVFLLDEPSEQTETFIITSSSRGKEGNIRTFDVIDSILSSSRLRNEETNRISNFSYAVTVYSYEILITPARQTSSSERRVTRASTTVRVDDGRRR